MTIYPDGEEVLTVGLFACGFHPKVREPHQFRANVNRPATTVFGSDAFPTAWDKAASLLHSFCTTQSLVDGNKRTGWAACWLLLRLNLAVGDLLGEVDADAAEALVANVATGDMLVPEIADALQAFVAPQLGNAGHLPPGFAVTEILEDTGQVMTGVGCTPDGTRLVYLCTRSSDGAPLELVLTPDQARNAADELTRFADGKLAPGMRIRVQALAVKAHLDLVERPEGL